MNIIDLQERLKDLPEEALMQEMQMPTGSAPQFLVLSELKRRKRMRDDYQRMQASDMKTVAEETITAAGMPQSGIMGVAQAMAPKSAIAQDTGLNDMQQMDPTQAPQPEQPMMMADGGYVRYMQSGGYPSAEVQQTRSILASDPGTQILAARMGMTVEEYIESLSPEARSLNIQRIAEGRRREGEARADVFDPALPVLDQVSSDLSDFEPKDPSSLLGKKFCPTMAG